MKSVFSAFAIASLLLMQPLAVAQEVPQPPAAAEPSAPAAPEAPAANEQLLQPGELEALVAPIALYPDNLLSLVLMASTYPLEIVEAQRWLEANRKLSAAQRNAAVAKQDWDQSVKSLIATPRVLQMMNTQLQWTRKLGDAVLAQEADVMDAVQRLRAQAQKNDKLKTTKQQRVTVQQTGPRPVIAIEPVNPEVIYVPYYEPTVVYGDWLYPDYPPYYFAFPSYYYVDGLIATGIAFGVGYGLAYWGGRYWGGSCNWNNKYIYDRGGNRWTHRPEHRRGVRYSSDRVQQRFGDSRGRDVRGRDVARTGERARTTDRQATRQAARQGGARTRDARRERTDGARSRQATRSQRAAQRAGSRNRAAQRQGLQRSRVTARQQGRARMTARGGGRNAMRWDGRGSRSAFQGGGREFRGGNRAVFRGGGGGFRSGGGSAFRGGGGGGFRGGGGAAFRGGGGGGRGGGGGGGRRSDIRLKQDIELVGRLGSGPGQGLGLYRFRYRGDPQRYVGVIAQDAKLVHPDAVTRGRDGYLRVRYDRIGFEFQTYEAWTDLTYKAQGL